MITPRRNGVGKDIRSLATLWSDIFEIGRVYIAFIK